MEINYNDMYSNYLMCKNCNRKTQGPEDYKNTKTGKVTKTCAKCRSCVLRSLAKRPQTKPHNKTTNRHHEEGLKDFRRGDTEKSISNQN